MGLGILQPAQFGGAAAAGGGAAATGAAPANGAWSLFGAGGTGAAPASTPPAPGGVQFDHTPAGPAPAGPVSPAPLAPWERSDPNSGGLTPQQFGPNADNGMDSSWTMLDPGANPLINRKPLSPMD